MTRINAFIPPAELCDQHLLAEHREIKRIPNQIKSGRFKLESAPKNFTLGKGHVSFFYDKLHWLLKRYQAIRRECYARGFNVTNYSEAWKGVPKELLNGWYPDEKEKCRIRSILRKRIADRMPAKVRFRLRSEEELLKHKCSAYEYEVK